VSEHATEYLDVDDKKAAQSLKPLMTLALMLLTQWLSSMREVIDRKPKSMKIDHGALLAVSCRSLLFIQIRD